MDVKVTKEQVLAIVKRKGTVIPVDISKELRTSTIIAGTFLSELVASKQVSVSSLKVGGSPVYYAAGQEYLLENFLYTHKGPEKIVLTKLKENSVLRDDSLEPVERVALRNAKDFAKQIEVTIGNDKLMFWKWSTLKNDEVQKVLEGMFAPKKGPEKTVEKSVETQKIIPEKTAEKIIETKKESSAEPKKEVQKELVETTKTPEVKTAVKPRKKRASKAVSDEKGHEKDIRTGHEGQNVSPERIETKGEFSKRVLEFFSKNNIEITSQKIIRESEIEYNGMMPTPVGKVAYYFVAKSKKKIADSDLAQVYVKKETLKLPIVFIYQGELTKKANEMLKNEFKTITVFKIE